jgi:hypothetical protein
MANSTVSILIRFKDGKVRRTLPAAYEGRARLKPGIGVDDGKERPCLKGVYFLRWYEGKRQVWKRLAKTHAMR